MNYQFAKKDISQHIVKYGVDIRPTFTPKQDKTKLQDYCNWLIEKFGEVFEVLLASPRELLVQKNFLLGDNKRAEMQTFVLTGRGPVFTFPQRLYIGGPHDLNIPDKDKIFRKALDELRSRFADKKVVRIGVINEIIFDTGGIDSVEIIVSNLKGDVWKQSIKNLLIRLEVPKEGKNINVEIRPTYLKHTGRGGPIEAAVGKAGFGIAVTVDINNQQMADNLTNSEVREIVSFANDYIPEELIKFLNNEY